MGHGGWVTTWGSKRAGVRLPATRARMNLTRPISQPLTSCGSLYASTNSSLTPSLLCQALDRPLTQKGRDLTSTLQPRPKHAIRPALPRCIAPDVLLQVWWRDFPGSMPTEGFYMPNFSACRATASYSVNWVRCSYTLGSDPLRDALHG